MAFLPLIKKMSLDNVNERFNIKLALEELKRIKENYREEYVVKEIIELPVVKKEKEKVIL